MLRSADHEHFFTWQAGWSDWFLHSQILTIFNNPVIFQSLFHSSCIFLLINRIVNVLNVSYLNRVFELLVFSFVDCLIHQHPNGVEETPEYGRTISYGRTLRLKCLPGKKFYSQSGLPLQLLTKQTSKSKARPSAFFFRNFRHAIE